jgi:broad specificity phosphatase PhoE
LIGVTVREMFRPHKKKAKKNIMTFKNKKTHPCNLRLEDRFETMGVVAPSFPTVHLDPSTTTNASHNKQSQVLEFTVYLIRHGEASHNVLEKIAKKQALEQALAEGLHKDDELTKERMENARQHVLLDNTLFDAPLSDLGKAEAKQACLTLESLSKEHNLQPPEEILVSPLTRTLETANLIFPNHDHVHVREELRERNTGKPPDTLSPANQLRARLSFARFSMNRLEEQTALQQEKLQQVIQEEEDKATLRERTRQLFRLLAESPLETKSIAVVTHKGYLRELERGPFENPSSPEFQNCEIRVYQIRFHPDNDSVDYARRIV